MGLSPDEIGSYVISFDKLIPIYIYRQYFLKLTQLRVIVLKLPYIGTFCSLGCNNLFSLFNNIRGERGGGGYALIPPPGTEPPFPPKPPIFINIAYSAE